MNEQELNVIEYLGEHGIKTGSHVYGVVVEDSDIDFILDSELVSEFKDILAASGIEFFPARRWYNDVNSSCYFMLDGEQYNIISLSEQDVKMWVFATEMMTKIRPIKDKILRHHMFDHFKELYIKQEMK